MTSLYMWYLVKEREGRAVFDFIGSLAPGTKRVVGMGVE